MNVLRNAEGDVGGGSLLASVATIEAPPAPPSGDQGAAPPPDAGVPPAAPEGPTLDEATGRWSDVPAKFWDPEAKALRLDERGIPAGLIKAHHELEKRFGALPSDAAGYKLELAEGEELGFTDADVQEFASKAHEWGLTNTQYNAALRAHMEAVAGIAGTIQAHTIEGAQAALLKHYGTEQAMTAELRDAYRAFSQFADPDEMAAIDTLGNNPIAVRVLAKIAKAMREDTAPNGMSQGADDLEIEKLTKDQKSAYWNRSAPG